MTQDREQRDFTVFLEGHEGHQGNVLAHAYIAKISKLLAVLAKLERAFLVGGSRRTDFEIVATEKYNPTTITLKPVPKVQMYDPRPALEWGLEQIERVGGGLDVDARVKSPVVRDLASLSEDGSDKSFKKFWINGHAKPIKFDDHYHLNALTLAKKMARIEAPAAWYSGVSMGEVVGRLEKIDNLDADHEFVIVPPVGPDKIVCKFPKTMEDAIGAFMFQMVRVKGAIHYSELSPHPEKIIVRDNGIALIQEPKARGRLRNMRGIFEGFEKRALDWESIFGA